jgi:ADP-heptose:LPS heptosyltransferase
VHILTLPSRVELGKHDILEPGAYVVDDVAGAHLLVLADGGTMRPLFDSEGGPERQLPDYTPGSVNTDKLDAVLFMRAGGFGDLILLTPVLREHKRRFPNCRIGVCTMSHYAVVLQGLDYIDEIVPYPPRIEEYHRFDEHVFFENAIERNPRARELHMTELFAEITGFEPGGVLDLKPDYRVKANEAIWANEALPRHRRLRRAAIQPRTSGACRTYPQELLGEVAQGLIKEGFEVFLLGGKGEVRLPPKGMPPELTNLTDPGISFRQSCAVLNTCDVFIGNDSALLHVAGALGVPGVGLYGPFPSHLRIKHSPGIVGINGAGDCAPCFHHANAALKNHFPAHCPSREQGHCQVLATIKPGRIVKKALEVARELPAPPENALQV